MFTLNKKEIQTCSVLLQELGKHFNWNWENDSRVLLSGDGREGLQIPKKSQESHGPHPIKPNEDANVPIVVI